MFTKNMHCRRQFDELSVRSPTSTRLCVSPVEVGNHTGGVPEPRFQRLPPLFDEALAEVTE